MFELVGGILSKNYRLLTPTSCRCLTLAVDNFGTVNSYHLPNNGIYWRSNDLLPLYSQAIELLFATVAIDQIKWYP